MARKKTAPPALMDEVMARADVRRIIDLIGQGHCGTCDHDWNRHIVGPGDSDGIWCLAGQGHSVTICTFPPSAGQWGTWHGMTAEDPSACVFRLGDGWAWKWECSCGAPVPLDGDDLKHDGLIANRESTWWQIATHLRMVGAPEASEPAAVPA